MTSSSSAFVILTDRIKIRPVKWASYPGSLNVSVMMTASHFSTLTIILLFTIITSEDFIDCFTSHRNVKATCHKPVKQRLLPSLSQCQEFCLSTPTCRNAQYDLYRSICELFEPPSLLESSLNKTHFGLYRLVSHRTEYECAPALQPSIGTVYLVLREECFEESKQSAYTRYAVPHQLNSTEEKSQPPPRDPFSTVPVEVLPAVPDCPVGEKARVQIIDGVQVVSSATVSFNVESPKKCVNTCLTSTFPDGSRLPLLCRSSHYDRSSSKCSIYSDAINPNGYLEYKPNSNVLYIEKLCISDMILPLQCDEVFRRIPQHVLLGHASEILTSTSEEECIRECISAKVYRGVACKSLLHYPDQPVANCILNIHSKTTRPEYFIPELEQKVDYVQIPECAGMLVEENVDTVASEGHMIDRDKNWGLPPGVGIVESEWSEWTACDRQTSARKRDRLCSDCVDRIQVQPCFSNENFNHLLNTFIDEHEEVGPPAIPLPSSMDTLPVPPASPFPQSSLFSDKNMSSDMDFLGVPLESLNTAWKSTFRKI